MVPTILIHAGYKLDAFAVNCFRVGRPLGVCNASQILTFAVLLLRPLLAAIETDLRLSR